ncbi:MAG TPA: hypothetical protein VGB04_13645 [Allosphingosinicella sp.]
MPINFGCKIRLSLDLPETTLSVRKLDRCREESISLPLNERWFGRTGWQQSAKLASFGTFAGFGNDGGIAGALVGLRGPRHEVRYDPKMVPRCATTQYCLERTPARDMVLTDFCDRETNAYVVSLLCGHEKASMRLPPEWQNAAYESSNLGSDVKSPVPAAGTGAASPRVLVRAPAPTPVRVPLPGEVAPGASSADGARPGAASTCAWQVDEICRKVEQLLEARPWANAFIVSPDSVKLERTFRLDLVVDPSKRTAKAYLEADNPGKQVQGRSVKWTYSMRAEIEPGPSFEATPQFPNPVMPVSETGPTTWSWKIKAVQAGDNDPIVVRLKAIFIVDGKAGEPVEVNVLKQPVVVKVPWWNGLVEWAERLGPFKELGGGALVVFLGGAVWRWWTKPKRQRRPRRRKKASAAA